MLKKNTLFAFVLFFLPNQINCLHLTKHPVKNLLISLCHISKRSISQTTQEAYNLFCLNQNFRVSAENISKIFAKVKNLNLPMQELKKFENAQKLIVDHQKFIESYFDFNNLSREEHQLVIEKIKRKYKAMELNFEQESIDLNNLEHLIDPQNKKSDENFSKYKSCIINYISEDTDLSKQPLGLFTLFHALKDNDLNLSNLLLKNGSNPNSIIQFNSNYKLPVYFMACTTEMLNLLKLFNIDLTLQGEYYSNRFSVLHQILRPEYQKELINEYLPLFDEIPVDSFGDTPWDILNFYSAQAPVEKMELYLKSAKKHWPEKFPAVDLL